MFVAINILLISNIAMCLRGHDNSHSIYTFVHSVRINGIYMVEYFNRNDDDSNKIETKNGQFDVKNGVTLNYKRDENGEFTFEDWSNGKKFGSTLRSIDAKLPNDCE